MHNVLIPVFSGTLSGAPVQLCDARTLHAFMQVKRDFSNWIKGRIRKFGFMAGDDFITIARSPELASGNRGASIDYHLALDMAKELAMVENNEQGRAARRYFIECERKALAGQPAISYSVQPRDKLTLTQGDELRAMLETAAQKLPAEKRGQFLQSGWAKLKAHTGVNYRQIPQAAHTDALSLLARHVADWELVQLTPAPTKRPTLPPGKILVDRQKLVDMYQDLGKLRARIDGLGILKSDLPPSWWAQHRISAG